MNTSSTTDGQPTVTWVLETKFKKLTDEEIEVLANKHLCYQIESSEISGVFNFARAILRKAQEK